MRWKTILETELIEVSDTGIVRHSITKKPYRTWPCPRGHQCLTVFVSGVKTSFRVHRLVGQAFCPDYRPHLRPRYRDGSKNPLAANLEWVTVATISFKPIGSRQGSSKLTETQASAILATGRSIHPATQARTYGVSVTAIRNILNRVTWRHLAHH